VTDVSFCVRRGEIFGLLGPNGAGKTTTIRMLTGQIDPSHGSASVAGFDVVRERTALKECIGVVFEDQNLYERLSAKLNLEFFCWLYRLPKIRVDAVLNLVGLRERAKEPIRNFSSGMKQRIMVARALLHQPRVLFLDEPTRGLDPIAARELRQTIATLSQEGITVLVTTHLMEEADHLCQRVAFLANGRIVANDTPYNLKLAHGKRKLVVVLAADPPADEGSSPFIERMLHIDSHADQALLVQWMSQGRIQSIHSCEATLEEVFVSVAGVCLN